ncbi:unnamed protein product [Pedinophyceae sp. YPF-701]|nr:unnamed protein product [Pedinophyceae sp. YPF-701]
MGGDDESGPLLRPDRETSDVRGPSLESQRQVREDAPNRGAAKKDEGLIEELWMSGAWRAAPLFILAVLPWAMIFPYLPQLMVDFFASEEAGYDLTCADSPGADQPQACRDAYSTVVTWQAWKSFASQAVLSFLLTPAVGRWSDLRGRRPVILFCTSLDILPLLALLAYLSGAVRLYAFWPLSALNQAVNSSAVILSWVSDVVRPSRRAAAFGALTAVAVFGMAGGPLAALFSGPRPATVAALCVRLVGVAYALVAVPETIGQRRAPWKVRWGVAEDDEDEVRRRKGVAGEERASEGWRRWLPIDKGALGVVLRSRLYRRLTLVLMLQAACSEGLQDTLLQYLMLVAGFTSKDNAVVLVVIALGGFLSLTFGLRTLLLFVSERGVLLTGLGGLLVHLLLLPVTTTRALAYGGLFVGLTSSLILPAISSMKANAAADDEQGAVQGALFGARAAAAGVGPLLFAGLFHATTSGSREEGGAWPLPYFPGAVFLLGAALTVAAMVVAHGIRAEDVVGVKEGARRQREAGRCSVEGDRPGTTQPLP